MKIKKNKTFINKMKIKLKINLKKENDIKKMCVRFENIQIPNITNFEETLKTTLIINNKI